MAKQLSKEETLAKIKAVLLKKWEKINAELQRIKQLDEQKLLLNTSARIIITYYLDKFKELAGNPPTKQNIKEIVALLNSLEYLNKVLFKIAKKKRARI